MEPTDRRSPGYSRVPDHPGHGREHMIRARRRVDKPTASVVALSDVIEARLGCATVKDMWASMLEQAPAMRDLKTNSPSRELHPRLWS
jgi:hypothetical protein